MSSPIAGLAAYAVDAARAPVQVMQTRATHPRRLVAGISAFQARQKMSEEEQVARLDRMARMQRRRAMLLGFRAAARAIVVAGLAGGHWSFVMRQAPT